MKKSTLIIIGVLIFVGLSLVSFYNRLISLQAQVDAQWAQVETQYQRRFDLIPNLVKSVEGIMEQEQDVFNTIAEARTRYGQAQGVNEQVEATNNLESALSRLLVVIENYPQLRSSENVTQLMDELSGTENRIAVERRRFNELVREYNISIKRFPGNLIAGMFGFEERPYFEAAEGAEKAPEVDINPEG